MAFSTMRGKNGKLPSSFSRFRLCLFSHRRARSSHDETRSLRPPPFLSQLDNYFVNTLTAAFREGITA